MPANPVAGYLGERRSILVVDDQEENPRLLQQLLEPLGFRVLLAKSGAEAVAIAQASPPDLVVMDLRMPGMDGVAAGRAIRSNLKSVCVIAASASSVELERAAADPETFSTCLRKPFQTQDLLDAIQHALSLDWRYADAGGERAAVAGQEEVSAVAPPRAVLEELLDLARLGKLVRLEQVALDLEQRDGRYGAFGRQLYKLARGFEEERLVSILEDCIEASRHDVAG
jgi:CheY-like chemotaxis protein